jgi:hypothetical protein
MICFHDNSKIEGKNHYVFYVNTGYSYSNNQLYTDLEEDIVHPGPSHSAEAISEEIESLVVSK